jgi:hypothetical protein
VALQSYHARLYVAVGCLLGFFPGTALVAWFVPGGVPGWLLNAYAFTMMGVCVVAGHIAMAWKCPRCGKRFHARRGWRNGFARRCLHCGLAKRE